LGGTSAQKEQTAYSTSNIKFPLTAWESAVTARYSIEYRPGFISASIAHDDFENRRTMGRVHARRQRDKQRHHADGINDDKEGGKSRECVFKYGTRLTHAKPNLNWAVGRKLTSSWVAFQI